MVDTARGNSRWIVGPGGLPLFRTQTFLECLLHARHSAELQRLSHEA